MKFILIVFAIFVGSHAQLPLFNFGSNGFGFSNRFFNGSFTPPQGSIEAGVPSAIPQFGNPLGVLARFARPVASGVSNAINNVNTNLNSNVNNVVNTVRSGFGSLVAGINRNLWNAFQDTVNRFSQHGIADPSAIFDRMSQFLPNMAQTMDNIVNYAKTAANSDVWKHLPGDVQKRIKSRMQNMVQRISEVTSAMNKLSENLPEFVFDHGLDSTLRNQPFFFPGRTGIVHLFEWKFDDIAVECEQVLGPNGYGGVQVSPVNEYLVSPNRAWWERYQPISFKINSRSGDEKQFSDMVRRCLRAGIRIYVDVVVNHMAAPGASAPLYGSAGSTCDPLGRKFPAVPFNESHFHADCVISNYKNATDVRDCELSPLPDLDQSKNHVRQVIINYLNNLIDLGVAGFRMDACKHMWPQDLKAIYDSLKPLNSVFFYPPFARPFIYQEVIDLGAEAVSAKEYTDLGVVTEFKWSTVIGQIFGGAFQADALSALTKNGSTDYLVNSSQALVFVDNHDNQRGHGAGGDSILTYKKKPQYIQAVSFTLATDYGIARVMSSYNFTNSDQGPPQDSLQIIKSPGFAVDGSCLNGWVCEHRWPEIRRMIRFKNYVEGTTLDHIQATSETFAFCRGEKGFIVFNNSQNTIEQTYHTCLPEGQYCDIISGELSQGTCTGNVIDVNSEGDATIMLPPNSVVAIYKLSKI